MNGFVLSREHSACCKLGGDHVHEDASIFVILWEQSVFLAPTVGLENSTITIDVDSPLLVCRCWRVQVATVSRGARCFIAAAAAFG
jgi:hypothetical protein